MLRKRVLEIRGLSPGHAYRLSQLEVASRILSLISNHGPALHGVLFSQRHSENPWCFFFFLETNTSPIPKAVGARHNKLVRLDSWGWDYKLSETNLQGFTSHSAFRLQICFPSTCNVQAHSEFYWERLEVNLFIIKERVGLGALDGEIYFGSCTAPIRLWNAPAVAMRGRAASSPISSWQMANCSKGRGGERDDKSPCLE